VELAANGAQGSFWGSLRFYVPEEKENGLFNKEILKKF